MSDGGEFDPCEYIWNTRLTMQRLLTMLQNSQQHCTDIECSSEESGPDRGSQTTLEAYIVVALWVIIVVSLFFNRPATMKKSSGLCIGSKNNEDDSSRPPDVPSFH